MNDRNNTSRAGWRDGGMSVGGKWYQRFAASDVAARWYRMLAAFGWLITGRYVAVFVGGGIGIVFARYLGPVAFGQWSYVLVVAGMLQPMMWMGSDYLVTRDIARRANDESYCQRILASGSVVRCLGVGLYGIGTLSLAALLAPGDPVFLFFVGLAWLGNAWSFPTAGHWQAGRLEMAPVMQGQMLGTLVRAMAMAALMLASSPLWAFFPALAMESCVAYAWLQRQFRRGGPRIRFRDAERQRVFLYLQRGWPVLIGDMGMFVYLTIDQVMLRQLRGNIEVGFYAAAFQYIGPLHLIGLSIGTATFPVLIKLKKTGGDMYEYRVQQLFDGVLWLGFSLAVAVTWFGPWAITHLQGSSFLAGVPPLLILGANLGFWFCARIQHRLLFVERCQHYHAVLGLLMVVINIALNLLLISRAGAEGAAWATLITGVLLTGVVPLLFRATRPLAWRVWRAFGAPLRAVIWLRKMWRDV